MWKAERELFNDILRGRADVVDDDPEAPAVIDWKAGYIQSGDYWDQVKSYAWLLQEKLKTEAPVVGIIVWLQFRQIERRTFSTLELAEHAAAVRDAVARIETDYRPGTHCGYCPRQTTCEARNQYMTSTAAPMMKVDKDTKLSPAKLAELWPQSRVLKSALASYEALVRGHLEAGPLELEGGGCLYMQTKTKSTIGAKKAWPVMKEHGLSDDQIGDVLSVSKKALLDIVGNDAPRGQKEKAKKQMMEELDEAGAVSVSKYRAIATKRK